MGRPRLDPDISHWARGSVRGGVRGSKGGAKGSRGGARGSRGGIGGKRGGVVGKRGGAVGKRGGKGIKIGGTNGGRGGKTSNGVAEVEGGGVVEVENEDDTIPEKYLVHLWKAMKDLRVSQYSIEEIKNTLNLTDSHMKQINDYNDTIEQVLPMSIVNPLCYLNEEEDPPQTNTQDGAEEIIPETQPESEEEEEEGINDTQELPATVTSPFSRTEKTDVVYAL
uniref:Uncharacterized protein n=1 Tax=Lactuca sativa TaxID=4236 RepID=A0A9R1X4W5_LACSA|nr:hypothetical protein LSAT_V11C600305290 [Lactuca sativa]